MLHEKPVHSGPLGDHDGDGDGAGSAWTGEKRRRNLPPSSSSSSGTAQDTVSHDMEGITQDHELLLARSDPNLQQQQQEDEIWGPELVISPEDAMNYSLGLSPDVPPIVTRSRMTPEDTEDVALRIARYRVAYYKSVGDPESARQLKDPQDYSVEEIHDNRYFLHLESHRSFEGYFPPADAHIAELDDYQRLRVHNNWCIDSTDPPYLYWEDYRAYYRTYEVDEDYVKFYGEVSSKVQWLKEYLHLEPKSQEWIEKSIIAGRQALRIASCFKNLSSLLVGMAFDEYISELRHDKDLEDLSLFYFEIWKLAALKKGTLREAVQKVYEMPKFGLESYGVEDAESKAKAIYHYEQKFRFLTLAGGIEESIEEDEALKLWRKIVFRKFKKKNMAMYAQQKLEIAKLMKLRPSQARDSRVTKDEDTTFAYDPDDWLLY